MTKTIDQLPAATSVATIDKLPISQGNITKYATFAQLPISDAVSTALAGKAASTHTHVAADISNSTAAGRALLTAADAAAQRTLLNVANGATANLADAVLLDRANHTGQQAFSTISDGTAAVRGIIGGGALAQGTNVTLSYNAGTGVTTISAAGGGGGGSLIVKESDTAVVASATTLDFGAGFDVSETPAGEANIALDLTEYAGGPLSLAAGGTGASTAAGARTALGLVIGTDVQAFNASIMTTGATETITGVKTFGGPGAVGRLKIAGSTSGALVLDAPAVAGTGTVVLPATGTLATLAGTETLSNKTMVAPALGTPASVVLTNATGLPVATGISGLGAGVATWLATPNSANLRAVVSDETGSGGGLVFATGPTISAPTLSGIVTTDGAAIDTPAAMAALAIDVTKGLNTKSISVDSTFTFSANPPANQLFKLLVTNTDTAAHVLTFPSSFDMGSNTTVTTTMIPAGGRLLLTWRGNGSATGSELWGTSPFLNNFAATAAPAATDDVTKGYGPGSFWGNATANTFYWCESNATGAAVWNQAGGGGGSGTVTSITLTQPAAGLTITGSGTAITSTGTPTFALANDLAAVEGLATTGIVRRTGTDTWSAGTAVGLTSEVTGTLPVANGGTGVTTSTGSGANVLATSPTLVTPVLGTPTSGNLSNCTADGTDAVGFRGVPVNSQSAAYTLVLADAGKCIYHPTSDATARTFTIPANGTVAYPIGTTIMFKNEVGAGAVTIAITTDTLVLDGAAGSTGSRTLAAGGKAVAHKVTATRWNISGTAELT